MTNMYKLLGQPAFGTEMELNLLNYKYAKIGYVIRKLTVYTSTHADKITYLNIYEHVFVNISILLIKVD